MIFTVLRISEWSIDDWSCISWIKFICRSSLNKTHSWLSWYKISFWIQQFFNLISSYYVSFLAIASRSSVQFSSISLVSRICLWIDWSLFFFRSAIFIWFNVKIVVLWYQMRSSLKFLNIKSAQRINALILIFCLSDWYIILKLKSASFWTQRIWCLLSSLSFINEMSAWWLMNILIEISVSFSSNHQCSNA